MSIFYANIFLTLHIHQYRLPLKTLILIMTMARLNERSLIDKETHLIAVVDLIDVFGIEQTPIIHAIRRHALNSVTGISDLLKKSSYLIYICARPHRLWVVIRVIRLVHFLLILWNTMLNYYGLHIEGPCIGLQIYRGPFQSIRTRNVHQLVYMS